MLACFALGIIIACLHDFFYRRLNGRSAEGGVFPRLQEYADVNDQSIVNFLGNLTTKMASGFLVGAISIAYAQVFWWKLRTRRMTIKRVDELQDFSSQPWNPLTWPSAYSLRLVAVVALCKALLSQVSNLTPGALTVTSALHHSICRVDNVNLTHADFSAVVDVTQQDSNVGPDVNGRALSFTTRVIVGGAVLAPPNRCGTCSYELAFSAPAVKCENITQESLSQINSPDPKTDMLALPVFNDSFRVWAGVYDGDELSSTNISSRNIVGSSPKALRPVEQLPVVALSCTAWQAMYHVKVNQSAVASVVASNITFGPQLLLSSLDADNATEPVTRQLLSLWGAFSYLLTGTVDYDTSSNAPRGGATDMAIPWSPIIDGSNNGIAWQWAGDLKTLIPDLMTNVSLSLLSGELSDVSNPTLTRTSVPCTQRGVVFVYSPLRLIVTYAVAVSLTFLCIAYGFYASKVNGRGEALHFSRILGAAAPPFTPSTAIDVTDNGKIVARERNAQP